MIYIVIGTIGFFVVHIFDIISLKRICRIKPYIWILGSGLIIYALVMLCLWPDKLLLPTWSTLLGWGLFFVSLSLLIYSLFINLPFRKTYVATGVSGEVIKTGLYALVRHPWIHYFALLLISLVLVSESSLLLIISPIWIFLNIMLIVVQDKFLFVKMFSGYDTYRLETPMLLPNRRSINAFISQLRNK